MDAGRRHPQPAGPALRRRGACHVARPSGDDRHLPHRTVGLPWHRSGDGHADDAAERAARSPGGWRGRRSLRHVPAALSEERRRRGALHGGDGPQLFPQFHHPGGAARRRGGRADLMYNFYRETPVDDGRYLRPTPRKSRSSSTAWERRRHRGAGHAGAQGLADQVSALWANFARNGVPSAPGIPDGRPTTPNRGRP